MKQNLTELVFVMDRSGSMQGKEEAVVSGFNELLEQQKAVEGEARVTLVTFASGRKTVYDRADIKSVPCLTREDYVPHGCTALLDAVGATIDGLGKTLSETPEEERPSQVIFAISTDGLENASTEYTYDEIKSKVEHQKEKYSWEFLFFGANIDAILTAGNLGIASERAATFQADSEGIISQMRCASHFMRSKRLRETIEDDWKDLLEGDDKK